MAGTELRKRRMKWRVAMMTATGLLLWPWHAEAHLVSTGLGPVYDGIGHLLLTPEDLVPIFALALYGGLLGSAAARKVLFLLPASWIAGGIIGLNSSWAPQLPIQPIWFLIPGILVALDLRLHPRWVAALAVAMGLLQGPFNGAAVKDVRSGALELLGVAVTIFVLVALVEGFVVSLQRPWTRIVVRVAGSWIAAMGLLLLGWSLHGRL